MTGFVASPLGPASPPASVVEADGAFWPDIDISAARAALRLGDSMVTHERLVAAIEGAMIAAMTDLAAWRAFQEAEGAVSLADVQTDLIVGGEPIQVVLWNRAVRYGAAAELADAYTDLAATNEGVTRAQDKRSIADDYRRMATVATTRLRATGIPNPIDPASTGGTNVYLV